MAEQEVAWFDDDTKEEKEAEHESDEEGEVTLSNVEMSTPSKRDEWVGLWCTAAEEGDVDAIYELILLTNRQYKQQEGFRTLVHNTNDASSLMICENWGNTPLHLACMQNQTNVVQLLLLSYSSSSLASLLYPIHAVNQFHETALHWACQNGNADIVHLLLVSSSATTTNADHSTYSNKNNLQGRFRQPIVTLVDQEGKTPLHRAVEAGHTKVVSLLLSFSTPAIAAWLLSTHDTARGNNPLHVACENGQYEMIQLLLSKASQLQNLQNQHQQQITTAVADLVNTRTSKTGMTPLHLLATSSCPFDNMEDDDNDDEGDCRRDTRNKTRTTKDNKNDKSTVSSSRTGQEQQKEEQRVKMHGQKDKEDVVTKCARLLVQHTDTTTAFSLFTTRDTTVAGDTPIHYAAMHGKVSLLRFFIQHCNNKHKNDNSSIDDIYTVQNGCGQTPLQAVEHVIQDYKEEDDDEDEDEHDHGKAKNEELLALEIAAQVLRDYQEYETRKSMCLPFLYEGAPFGDDNGIHQRTANYTPPSLWPTILERMLRDHVGLAMGCLCLQERPDLCNTTTTTTFSADSIPPDYTATIAVVD